MQDQNYHTKYKVIDNQNSYLYTFKTMDDSLVSAASTPPLTLTQLQQQAIKAALEARWEDALNLNNQILKIESTNVDALNRIARAHFELGDYTQAEKNYKAALDIDQYNPIAQKNLKIIQTFKKSGAKQDKKPIANNHITSISPSLFLNEPGKTKIVNLLKVAEPQKLSQAYCGMPVELSIKSRGISAVDGQGRYLGVLPDDISFQLLRLMKGGNKYFACVKAVKVNGLSLLIRETYRSKKFRNQPSFLESTGKRSSEIVNFSRNTEDQSNEDSNESEEQTAI